MKDPITPDTIEDVVRHFVAEGGAAFPAHIGANQFLGMTKREAYALGAMQGLLANPTTQQAEPLEVANAAFEVADAMLKAGKR